MICLYCFAYQTTSVPETVNRTIESIQKKVDELVRDLQSDAGGCRVEVTLSAPTSGEIYDVAQVCSSFQGTLGPAEFHRFCKEYALITSREWGEHARNVLSFSTYSIFACFQQDVMNAPHGVRRERRAYYGFLCYLLQKVLFAGCIGNHPFSSLVSTSRSVPSVLTTQLIASVQNRNLFSVDPDVVSFEHRVVCGLTAGLPHFQRDIVWFSALVPPRDRNPLSQLLRLHDLLLTGRHGDRETLLRGIGALLYSSYLQWHWAYLFRNDYLLPDVRFSYQHVPSGRRLSIPFHLGPSFLSSMLRPDDKTRRELFGPSLEIGRTIVRVQAEYLASDVFPIEAIIKNTDRRFSAAPFALFGAAVKFGHDTTSPVRFEPMDLLRALHRELYQHKVSFLLHGAASRSIGRQAQKLVAVTIAAPDGAPNHELAAPALAEPSSCLGAVVSCFGEQFTAVDISEMRKSDHKAQVVMETCHRIWQCELLQLLNIQYGDWWTDTRDQQNKTGYHPSHVLNSGTVRRIDSGWIVVRGDRQLHEHYHRLARNHRMHTGAGVSKLTKLRAMLRLPECKAILHRAKAHFHSIPASSGIEAFRGVYSKLGREWDNELSRMRTRAHRDVARLSTGTPSIVRMPVESHHPHPTPSAAVSTPYPCELPTALDTRLSPLCSRSSSPMTVTETSRKRHRDHPPTTAAAAGNDDASSPPLSELAARGDNNLHLAVPESKAPAFPASRLAKRSRVLTTSPFMDTGDLTAEILSTSSGSTTVVRVWPSK